MFKGVQHANSLIGTPQARQDFDLRATFAPHNRNSDKNYWNNLQKQQQQEQSEPSNPFSHPTSFFPFSSSQDPSWFTFEHGASPSFTFSRFPRATAASSPSPSVSTSTFKSIYMQHVPISLSDLYSGRSGVTLTLRNTFVKQYDAAIRGGIAYGMWYQAALMALPLARFSRTFAIVVAFILAHSQLPKPLQHEFKVHIKPGYKAGTTITFHGVPAAAAAANRDSADTNNNNGWWGTWWGDNSKVDVVFVLQEQPHPVYSREGNDLIAAVTISKNQARKGCTIQIPPLVESDPPLSLRLAPRQIKYSRQVIIIKNKGWPLRKRRGGGGGEGRGDDDDKGQYGDLVVQVEIKSNPLRPTWWRRWLRENKRKLSRLW